jgi:lysophospholipase L1-like esterase
MGHLPGAVTATETSARSPRRLGADGEPPAPTDLSRWQQPAGTASLAPVPAVVAWAVGALPAAISLARQDYGRTWVVAFTLATIVVAAAIAALPRLWPLVAAATLIAFELVTTPGIRSWPPHPHPVPDLLLLATAGWAVALGTRGAANATAAPRPPRARLLLFPLLAADIALLARPDLRAAGLAAAVAVATWLLTAATPSRLIAPLDHAGQTVDRALTSTRTLLDRAAAIVGRLIGVLAMVPVAIFLTIAWAVHRLVRLDVLAPPTADGSSWVERSSADIAPTHLAAQVLVVDPRRTVRRGQRWLAAIVVIAVFVGAIYALPGSQLRDLHLRHRQPGSRPASELAGVPDPNPPVDEAAPKAMAGEPWFKEYRHDLLWVMHGDNAFQPLNDLRTHDVKTRYVNIVDGRRVTWQPPACRCRPLTVWFYGGSTTFGFGQRDEQTPPSELAKAAWKDGLAVRVLNRGVVGDTHWEESRRLAWDLATQPAPDLVVFYDGVNDTAALDYLNTQTIKEGPDTVREASWLAIQEAKVYDLIAGDSPSTPQGASVTPDRRFSWTAAQAGAMLAQRYEDSRETSKILTAAHHLPVVYFWQAALVNRQAAYLEMPQDNEAYGAERSKVAVARLGSDVHNLTHLFDGVRRPVFITQTHTNELGARMVAQAIYRQVRPQIEALAGRTGRGRPAA